MQIKHNAPEGVPSNHLRKADPHLMESLERRTLLSGWSTEDDFMPFNPGFGSYAINQAMTADANGNVYAVGEAADFEGVDRHIAFVRQKTSGSASWQTVGTVEGSVGSPSPAIFQAVAAVPTGELYVSGRVDATTKIWKGTWNAGSLSLSVVDSGFAGYYGDIAVDAAGNVFAVGSVSVRQGRFNTTSHWIVRKQTGGQGAFTTVDDYLFNGYSAGAQAIAVIPSGPSAGVYVAGGGGGGTSAGANWIVRKSTNAGSTWSTVDTFQLDPATKAPSSASDIAAHEDGTLYVVGSAATGIRTGGNPQHPTYTYTKRWFMRSSSNGGASWSNHDVYPETAGTNAGSPGGSPVAVTTDLAGNVYLAGDRWIGDISHTVVRTNADGTWSTSDDYAYDPGSYGASVFDITRDASGTIYFGGSHSGVSGDRWFVRSMSPGAMAQAGGTGGSIFADFQIADANDDRLEQLL